MFFEKLLCKYISLLKLIEGKYSSTKQIEKLLTCFKIISPKNYYIEFKKFYQYTLKKYNIYLE